MKQFNDVLILMLVVFAIIAFTWTVAIVAIQHYSLLLGWNDEQITRLNVFWPVYAVRWLVEGIAAYSLTLIRAVVSWPGRIARNGTWVWRSFLMACKGHV